MHAVGSHHVTASLLVRNRLKQRQRLEEVAILSAQLVRRQLAEQTPHRADLVTTQLAELAQQVLQSVQVVHRDEALQDADVRRRERVDARHERVRLDERRQLVNDGNVELFQDGGHVGVQQHAIVLATDDRTVRAQRDQVDHGAVAAVLLARNDGKVLEHAQVALVLSHQVEPELLQPAGRRVAVLRRVPRDLRGAAPAGRQHAWHQLNHALGVQQLQLSVACNTGGCDATSTSTFVNETNSD